MDHVAETGFISSRWKLWDGRRTLAVVKKERMPTMRASHFSRHLRRFGGCMIHTPDDVLTTSAPTPSRSCSSRIDCLRVAVVPPARRPRFRRDPKSWGVVLAALAIFSAGSANYAFSGWNTVTNANGLGGNYIKSILEDRSGNLWVGTDGGVSRYDGQNWRTFTTADGLGANSVGSILEGRSGNLWVTSGTGVSKYDGQTWRPFTIGNGLGSEYVTAMIEDRSGNFWAGTSGSGVSRYDGQTWRTFTVADGLGNNYVTAMIEDRSGNLWVGTTGGVSRYGGNAWETFTTADGLGDNTILSMLEDRSGNIWVGTHYGGVSRYDGQTWRTFTYVDGTGGDLGIAMFEDRSGNLWVGTEGGVSRYDGQGWRTFTTTDGLPSNYVSSMLEDRSGNIWARTCCNVGVSRYDGKTWRTFTTADGLGADYVTALLEDRWGNLWLGTYQNGVSRYDGSGWRTFTNVDGLAGNEVTVMLEDHSRNLWVGTIHSGGLSRYDGQTWRTFLADYMVTALLEDRWGNLWLGTYQNGVSRYDGQTWRTFTTADGLADITVTSMLEDRAGNLWFGTALGGVSRYDGSTWRTFTTSDGLGANSVGYMLEDHSGNLWVSAFNPLTNTGGVSRYDGQTWKTFTTADGLGGNDVTSMLEDRSGNLWFAAFGGGVSRYDGQTWKTFTTDDGLGSASALAMLEDRSGNLWVGTSEGGVSRYDGQTWETITTADGLRNKSVRGMLEDRAGNLWFSTVEGGVSRYDGSEWRRYSKSDGLGSDVVIQLLEDHGGSIWFGTLGGATRYDPDRVPPRTLFNSRPPPVSAATTLTAGFVAAFNEAQVQFSSRLDSLSWSPWSPVGSWTGAKLLDGHHTLQVRARDREGNVEVTPALVVFDVDATPPAPVIEAPAFGQAVRGTVAIRGTATDARFTSFRVAVRSAGAASWNSPDAAILAQSTTPVESDLLGSWDTSALPDGNYDLRLAVSDSLGLTGVAQVTVVVDNHFPFVEETAPAKVTAASGGNLYTTNQELHLYFPPHAFDQDILVSISAATSLTDTLPSGAIRVLPGFDIEWSAASLRKSATLAFSTAGRAPVPGTLAIYSSSDGLAWQRLGGTPDHGKVSLAVRAPGRYALFAESSVITGTGTLAGLAFTPRVFSPAGSFASSEVGISFTLGRPAPVTVRVYSRSGRLIREVVSGQAMNAGANLVRWDGRDRNGGFAVDGLYLVTVEALGRTERKTLAVVK